MNRIFFFIVALFILCVFVNAQNIVKHIPLGTPAPSNVGRIKFSQILPAGRQINRIQTPDAGTVQLDMIKDTAGVWAVPTDFLREGYHHYTLYPADCRNCCY